MRELHLLQQKKEITVEIKVIAEDRVMIDLLIIHRAVIRLIVRHQDLVRKVLPDLRVAPVPVVVLAAVQDQVDLIEADKC